MPEESFGQTLRRERQRRGVSLEMIAAQTKVSASLFAELERDNVTRWPDGIFRRAFIRGYADAIGLDPDRLVSEFVRIYPEEPNGSKGVNRVRALVASEGWYPGLRLMLVEEEKRFGILHPAGGWRTWSRERLAPAIVDLLVPISLAGICASLAEHRVPMFFASLALILLAYQLAGTLLLGATVGRWLLTLRPPSIRRRHSSRRTIPFRRRSLVSRLVAHRRRTQAETARDRQRRRA
jgi:transcriptional regulator with XRE-family HTH domain